MQDGQILRRSPGDQFQIYLAPGFDAFLYVYAVDATGWVAGALVTCSAAGYVRDGTRQARRASADA